MGGGDGLEELLLEEKEEVESDAGVDSEGEAAAARRFYAALEDLEGVEEEEEEDDDYEEEEESESDGEEDEFEFAGAQVTRQQVQSWPLLRDYVPPAMDHELATELRQGGWGAAVRWRAAFGRLQGWLRMCAGRRVSMLQCLTPNTQLPAVLPTHPLALPARAGCEAAPRRHAAPTRSPPARETAALVRPPVQMRPSPVSPGP